MVMRSVALFLASLALQGLGRRLHMGNTDIDGSANEGSWHSEKIEAVSDEAGSQEKLERDQQVEEKDASSELAKLLMAFNPAVARHVTGVQSGLDRPSIASQLAHMRSTTPEMMGKKKKPAYGGGNAYSKQSAQESKDRATKQKNREASYKSEYMYTILGLTKTLPDGSRTLIKDINLCFFPGAKIGLVGLNGAGKSTLLKIMAGVDKDYTGTSEPQPGKSVGYLPQEPEIEEKTVDDALKKAVASSQAVLDRFNELSAKVCEPLEDDEMTKALEDLAEVQEKIDSANLWELDRIVDRAALALRCPPKDAIIENLSGGEKRRVALARLLIENHDVLLLDEPTNHLDAQSITWLQTFLEDYKGTVVAITHDRYFLDETCKWILELERGEGKPFEGNYASWLEQKGQMLEQQKKSNSKFAKTLAAELEWVRATPKARQAKSKSRLARYEELAKKSDAEALAHSTQIYIPPGPRLGQEVISARKITKGFGDRVLIQDLSFDLPRGGIVGIIGPNGAGKTTLIKMLTGEEKPDSGELEIGSTVKLVAVNQTREGLNDANSVFEEVAGGTETMNLGSGSINSRKYISWFGFSGDGQKKKIKSLSGGERNRVQLAKLLSSGGNVLLFDEPTNDLDVQTMQSLEEALLDFGGCAVVVSHDRFFLDKLATHILAAEGEGKWVYYEGNYQEYEADRIKRMGDAEPEPIKFAKLVTT